MITVIAHGIVQRADLPIPAVVFAWCSAAVLVVSFVGLAAMWPRPRLQSDTWRPLWRVPAPVDWLCGAIGVALLALVVWTGFDGVQDTYTNFAPTFVYILFWVGLVFVSAVFGDVFRALSPWRALGRLLRLRGVREYPERLGRWPAALGLLAFTWTELVGQYGTEPNHIAICAVLYTAFTLGGCFLYGTEAWCSRGEAFGVYFGLFARISVFESRNGVIGRRRLLAGLPPVEPLPGTIATVAVMIGTVTFDGLSQGAVWKEGISKGLNNLLDGPFGATGASYVTDTIGLLAGPLLVGGFYLLGIRGAESVGGGISVERLRGTFIHSLVPIAMAYAMAHYFSFLFVQGQGIIALGSDPLGHGWDLLGTAQSGIDFSLLSLKSIWYFQVAFVVAGHVAGLVLAHDRALVLYEDQQLAVRSQYWMLSVMVGFTSLALWLLSQAS